MWSSLFSASNALQARSAAPRVIPEITEQERSRFLSNLPKIKSLPSDNYTSNCKAVLEHARPKGAILSVYYLHKNKLMGIENGQFLFDIVVKSEQPMATATQIHGFVKHTSLKSDDPEYELKIRHFINTVNGAVEAEPSVSVEKAADAEQSDDEESATGFVFV